MNDLERCKIAFEMAKEGYKFMLPLNGRLVEINGAYHGRVSCLTKTDYWFCWGEKESSHAINFDFSEETWKKYMVDINIGAGI